MEKKSRIIPVPRYFLRKRTPTGTLRNVFLTIGIIALLVFLTVPVGASYDPESAFTTEVLLNKPGLTYELSQFDNYAENGSVNIKENEVGSSCYIYRSHFNQNLGVVIREINETLPDLSGLSVSLAIPVEWSVGANGTMVPGAYLDPETLDWNNAMRTELEWLVNGSIVKGLNTEDIQGIGIKAKAGYAGWNSRIVNENGSWMPYNETEDPQLLFESPGFQLDPDDLPDISPHRETVPKQQEGNDYIIIAVTVGAIIVIVGTFSYTRLKRKAILDNLNRKNIYERIKTKPGIHVKALARELNLKPGTLSYHINILEKEEFIKSHQDGIYRRFYLFGTKRDLKMVLSSIQYKILKAVNDQPGISQSDISRTIGKNRMLIHYHLKILDDVGILTYVKSGRKSSWYTTSLAMSYLSN